MGKCCQIYHLACYTALTGVLMFLFGTYWLANPDVISPNGDIQYCWAQKTPLIGDAKNWAIFTND